MMTNSDDTQPVQPRKRTKPWLIVIGIVLGLAIIFGLFYFLWLKPRMTTPLGAVLDLPKSTETDPDQDPSTAFPDEDAPPPLCGDQSEWLILVVGTDYREGNYLYGLADAIRIVHVDFTIPQVNVVALPRALLIEDPGPHLDVDEPLLLNQAYFFGTEGMGHFSGSGYGAGALAETLQANFGLSVDNYLVMDFYAFQNLIDRLGGIQVDLPSAVGDFPAGVQWLDGEEALKLARYRTNSSDNARIDNQTAMLKGIIQRLQTPEMLLQLPQLSDALGHTVLTDVTPQQIQNTICLVDKLDSAHVQFYNPSLELIEDDREFIPTMDKEMNIFRWDQDLEDWLIESLWAEPET